MYMYDIDILILIDVVLLYISGCPSLLKIIDKYLRYVGLGNSIILNGK
jgi:hypothetical protein